VTRQQELLDKLMTGLDLEFKDATGDKDNEFKDGWYIWRYDSECPLNQHEIVSVVKGVMSGLSVDCTPYGQLAGPILGRWWVKANRITYHEKYSDGSGVEFSVTYKQEPYLHDEKIIGFVDIAHGDEITFPITKVEWLIECLQRVLSESGVGK